VAGKAAFGFETVGNASAEPYARDAALSPSTQAYAKICGPDFEYYVQTLSITLGRLGLGKSMAPTWV
jgi:hypothetical protein